MVLQGGDDYKPYKKNTKLGVITNNYVTTFAKNNPYSYPKTKRRIMKKRISFIVMTLVVISVIMSPFPALAATTSSTQITGNVPATISMTSTSSLAMPSLIPGTTVESSYITVTVSTNTNGWSLTAAESGGGVDGKMDRNGGIMTNALEIQGGNVSTYTPLTSTVTLRNANGTAGTIPFDNIKFRQVVAVTEVAGDYSITVVFTVSGGA
jgi:hypothetical protein